ncbi:MAG: ABC transporter substrate-binding protein, partial [Microvirga sp.]
IQAMAKWLHPDLFKDIDPEQTMKALYDRVLPVPYKTGYWVSLTDKE